MAEAMTSAGYRNGQQLDARDVSKSFGAVRAVHRVSLSIAEGEILGIIGPNGSGKTTLLHCLSGYLRADEGSVLWRGTNITHWPMDRRARQGLVRTFQQVMVFPKLTVADNVRVAFENRCVERPATTESVADTLRFVGLDDKALVAADELSYGQLKKLGVAIALGLNPYLLLMDEPAAGLNDNECLELANLIRSLRDSGITVAVVDHNMHFLLPLSGRVVALDAGEKICEGPPEVVQSDSRVISGYLGDKFASRRNSS
jgi:ABC-type branched-subunit amino acid transport system ATPase component